MPELKKGKQRSRRNAVTHGIFASILLKDGALGESEKDYSGLLSALRRALSPSDDFEDILIQSLSLLYLRLTRVYAADWQAALKLFEKVDEVLEEGSPTAETEWVDRENHVLVLKYGPSPDLLMRYESGIQRQIGRTLGMLQQWRQMRRGPEFARRGDVIDVE